MVLFYRKGKRDVKTMLFHWLIAVYNQSRVGDLSWLFNDVRLKSSWSISNVKFQHLSPVPTLVGRYAFDFRGSTTDQYVIMEGKHVVRYATCTSHCSMYSISKREMTSTLHHRLLVAGRLSWHVPHPPTHIHVGSSFNP